MQLFETPLRHTHLSHSTSCRLWLHVLSVLHRIARTCNVTYRVVMLGSVRQCDGMEWKRMEWSVAWRKCSCSCTCTCTCTCTCKCKCQCKCNEHLSACLLFRWCACVSEFVGHRRMRAVTLAQGTRHSSRASSCCRSFEVSHVRGSRAHALSTT